MDLLKWSKRPAADVEARKPEVNIVRGLIARATTPLLPVGSFPSSAIGAVMPSVAVSVKRALLGSSEHTLAAAASKALSLSWFSEARLPEPSILSWTAS